MISVESRRTDFKPRHWINQNEEMHSLSRIMLSGATTVVMKYLERFS